MGNLVVDNAQNAQSCICPQCPTYKKSELTGILYCAKGKAAESAEAAGCICPNCPVAKQYNLDQPYYCMKGKSVDLK
ncbi:MAG: DUF2769 domain-containing protein [Candidatus Bathyarchaeota archaeon]|nr:DUF2769 domain-containing protein [Candidatus Termiticorpusculum sp.]